MRPTAYAPERRKALRRAIDAVNRGHLASAHFLLKDALWMGLSLEEFRAQVPDETREAIRAYIEERALADSIWHNSVWVLCRRDRDND